MQSFRWFMHLDLAANLRFFFVIVAQISRYQIVKEITTHQYYTYTYRKY